MVASSCNTNKSCKLFISQLIDTLIWQVLIIFKGILIHKQGVNNLFTIGIGFVTIYSFLNLICACPWPCASLISGLALVVIACYFIWLLLHPWLLSIGNYLLVIRFAWLYLIKHCLSKRDGKTRYIYEAWSLKVPWKWLRHYLLQDGLL